MQKIVILIFILFITAQAMVEFKGQEFLGAKISVDSLAKILVPQSDWHPYPQFNERDVWMKFPEEIQLAAIRGGEAAQKEGFPQLPASVFLEYVRTGNRSNFQNISFKRRSNLAACVWAEIFEGQGRFMDSILNGVWLICEETYWGIPAHVGVQKAGSGLPDVSEPTIDLFAAETGALLSWVHYLLGEELNKLSPLVVPRIEYEMNRRIFTPFENDNYSWLGFRAVTDKGYAYSVNNWNPWINSNVLPAILLIEKDADRRTTLVHRVMKSLDNFTGPYPSDGGCDEGPNYWGRAGGSLYDCLEILHLATNGAIDIYAEPLVQKMGQFIYKAYISPGYVINFADANARLSLEPPLVYRYGKAIQDKQMQEYAAFFAHEQELQGIRFNSAFGAIARTLPALFIYDQMQQTNAAIPYTRDVWLPDLQVMAARSHDDNTDGFYLAAKGGHNNESHNHNDIGNFIVYYNGEPLLIDAGAATYTAKTFSGKRYELWNNQSAFHNLPTINGFMQKNGEEFRAEHVKYKSSRNKVQFQLDISGAYEKQAGVQKWVRDITFNRKKGITLTEYYELNRVEEPVQLHFLSFAQPIVRNEGEIVLGEKLFLSFAKNAFDVNIKEIPIPDNRMQGSWGEKIYRITLTDREQKQKGKFVFELTD